MLKLTLQKSYVQNCANAARSEVHQLRECVPRTLRPSTVTSVTSVTSVLHMIAAHFDTVFTMKCQIIPQSSQMSDSLFYKGLIQFPKPSVNISQRSSQEKKHYPYPVVGKLNSPAIPISLAPQFMSSWRITSLSKWLITLQ